jgi:hypothetical protein
MKRLSISALFVALGAAASFHGAAAATAVKLTPSSISMSSALKACPNAVGAVSFVLGHTRVAEASGVTAAYTGLPLQTITFKDASGSALAQVTANAHANSVSGANVKAAAGKTVACVFRY